MPSNTVYPLSAIRALALHAQGLARPLVAGGKPIRDEVYAAIEQIGGVQIDTLQMVSRSQYLTLWSRLGSYDTNDLDTLHSDVDDRRLYEYWLHAACLIPIPNYRYSIPAMERYRRGVAGWRRTWINRPGNRKLVEETYEHIRVNGAVRTADFDIEKRRRGEGWWDWKPAKVALEHLYNQGDLMVSGRSNFQRIYDLKERVLPNHVDKTPATEEEEHIHRLKLSMRALGVCLPTQVADYTHMKRTVAKPYIERLRENGTFVTLKGRLHGGIIGDLLVHRCDLDTLQRAADGELSPERTTFLSPFDNLFWAKARDMHFWGFRQVLEAYKPEPQRIWGYFCLPILRNDTLIGRFDPKLERREGVLRLRSLYLEPDAPLDDALIADVAAAMRDFMAFHSASDLIIDRSEPLKFGERLLKAL